MSIPDALVERMRAGRPVPLKTSEAAVYANVSRRTIQRAIAAGELKVWRRGSVVRIIDTELDRWLLLRDQSIASSPIPPGARSATRGRGRLSASGPGISDGGST